MISRAVLKVIDLIEADFGVEIWLGHHLVALEGVYGQNLLSTFSMPNYIPNESSWHERTEKLVLMIFDTINSAKLFFFFVYQGFF